MENLTTNFYEVNIKDEIAILLFKNDVFELLCNRGNSDLLLNTLDGLEKDQKIKALLFINEPDYFGEKVYDIFLNTIMFSETKSKESETSNFHKRNLRNKEIITLNRFVEYISNYSKICFAVVSGGIVTPFFGLSQAIDILYGTTKTYFSLAHNKYGLHPSGGLPYFLVQKLGYNKAIELMFSDKISSIEALELGLINKVVPDNDFLGEVIEEIKKVTKFNSSVLRSTKRLSSNVRNSLSDYLEYETVYKP